MPRYILMADMNAFFANCERQANRRLRSWPVGVVRKPWESTIVSAACYQAKARGVETGMAVWEAKRLCPEIRLVLEDPAKYTYASTRVFSILKEFSPLLEVFSIDEAWVDISQAAERLGGPVAVAQAIKHRIREELGEEITCSIGIGPSKVLAKIAAEQVKPDGLTWIKDEELSDWLERLEVDAAIGIGDRRKAELARMKIRTRGPATGPFPVMATNPYFDITVDCGTLTTARETHSLRPFYFEGLQTDLGNHYLRLEVQGMGIDSIRLQLFDFRGLLLVDHSSDGSALTVPLRTEAGGRLANGVYLYVVRMRGFNGEEYVSQVRKLVILR
jgi:hypothetical protein